MKYKLISSATLPRNQAQKKDDLIHTSDQHTKKIGLSFLGILLFLAGLPSTFSINVIGELYITELILPVIAVLVAIFGKTNIFKVKLFWQFTVACLVMIIAFIVTDLAAGTGPDKYIRAWGRNFLLFTDLIALAIIAGSDRRLLWWFLLGASVGPLIQLIALSTPISEWKIGYGRPIIWLALLFSIFVSGKKMVLILVALATASIYFDSRSMGAFCLLVAGVIFIRTKYPESINLSPKAVFRIVLSSVLVITVLLTLMENTESEFSNRRDSSSTGRFAALSVGLVAITDSPVLGHGSWGHGTEKYAEMIYHKLLPKMIELGRDRQWEKSDRFRPHSQILQTWIEGGIFAVTFFIIFGYQLYLGLTYLILFRRVDYFTPLYSFLLITSSWHLLMSPYGGNHRIPIAISISILCILAMERKTHEIYNNRSI